MTFKGARSTLLSITPASISMFRRACQMRNRRRAGPFQETGDLPPGDPGEMTRQARSERGDSDLFRLARDQLNDRAGHAGEATLEVRRDDVDVGNPYHSVRWRNRRPVGPSVRVLETHDVVLSEVVACLYLDQLQERLARILQAVPGAFRNERGLVFVNQECLAVSCHLRDPAHDDPVFRAVTVGLQGTASDPAER